MINLNKLPQNIALFMPLHQQAIVKDPECYDEYKSTIDMLDKEIDEIPKESQSFADEQIAEKGSYYDCLVVYAHFFYAGCDWFILNWDRKNEIVYCYAILNGDTQMSELGTTYLSDLTGHGRIELDFYWSKCSLAQALYDKYPEDFTEPHISKQIPKKKTDWRAKIVLKYQLNKKRKHGKRTAKRRYRNSK